jgi:hypothetical protein
LDFNFPYEEAVFREEPLPLYSIVYYFSYTTRNAVMRDGEKEASFGTDVLLLLEG